VTTTEAVVQQKKQQQLVEATAISASTVDGEWISSSSANESLHYDVDQRPHLRRSYFWDWIMVRDLLSLSVSVFLLFRLFQCQPWD
jgi:hypothetical protein